MSEIYKNPLFQNIYSSNYDIICEIGNNAKKLKKNKDEKIELTHGLFIINSGEIRINFTDTDKFKQFIFKEEHYFFYSPIYKNNFLIEEVTAAVDSEILFLDIVELSKFGLLKNKLNSLFEKSYFENAKLKNTLMSFINYKKNVRNFTIFIIYFTVIVNASIYIFSHYHLSPKVRNLNWFLFSWGYLISIITTCLYFINKSKMRLSEFGLNFIQKKRTILETSFFLCVVGFLFFLITFFYYTYQGISIVMVINNSTVWRINTIEYFFHCMGQEFIFRGFLQTLFQRYIFQHSHSLKTIFLISSFFGLLHIGFGLHVAALAFLISLPLCYLFERHKNIYGVTVLHFSFGFFAKLFGIF